MGQERVPAQAERAFVPSHARARAARENADLTELRGDWPGPWPCVQAVFAGTLDQRGRSTQNGKESGPSKGFLFDLDKNLLTEKLESARNETTKPDERILLLSIWPWNFPSLREYETENFPRIGDCSVTPDRARNLRRNVHRR